MILAGGIFVVILVQLGGEDRLGTVPRLRLWPHVDRFVAGFGTDPIDTAVVPGAQRLDAAVEDDRAKNKTRVLFLRPTENKTRVLFF